MENSGYLSLFSGILVIFSGEINAIFLFISGGAGAAAFIFKIVVVQRFRGVACPMFENGTVPVPRHARFGGVHFHFSPHAARRGRAGVLAQLAARRFQFGGVS